MSLSNNQRESDISNNSSPLLNSLLASKHLALMIFDSNGKITGYSESLTNILEAKKEFYLGKNIDSLQISKSEKRLVLLDYKSGFTTSRKIYDVKLVTAQNRILNVNVSIDLSFLKEKLSGGIIHFEQIENGIPELRNYNNLLSKSKFLIKEPLRISKHFAQKLEEKISKENSETKEYISFISKNISSLDCLVNHLIILENLNTYYPDYQYNNLEVIALLEIQKKRNSPFNISIDSFPESTFCDRELMKLLIKTIINFSSYYSNGSLKFLKIDSRINNNQTVFIFITGAVEFLGTPSFSPNFPLNKNVRKDNPSASGYELVIINRIAQLHGGTMHVSLNKSNETQIEIHLPNK